MTALKMCISSIGLRNTQVLVLLNGKLHIFYNHLKYDADKKEGGVMEHLRELLAVNHRQALDFFVLGLRDVCETGVDWEELFYNASVLAHYAQTSTQTADKLANGF